jgi:hypothetical protein
MSEANVEIIRRDYEVNARNWAECGVLMRGSCASRPRRSCAAA